MPSRELLERDPPRGLSSREAQRKLPSDRARPEKFSWIDIVWLVFIGGLAALPPITEIHKQLTLLAIGIFQIFEARLIAWRPGRGRVYSVLIKILLATLLLGHTGEAAGINSSYWPIYFLPVVTAAMYFGPFATLAWTAVTCAAYCSYLIPASREFEITAAGWGILGIHLVFLFLAAIIVNRFVVENRRQVHRYQEVSETLAESNRKLQQAEADARRAERLAALGHLSAGLAHEIRNPLGIIKGSAEMLNQKLAPSTPVASELAGYILEEVNRLNVLVSRFLDFARPSRLELAPVNLAPVLERALAAVQSRYPSAGVKVERRFVGDLPAVSADEQLCEQVFTNLILNAYEAMSEDAAPGNGMPLKTKTLTLVLEPASQAERPGVAAEIGDTGPGIPANLREQVFNPFFTSKKTGVGLGLSIVAKIVQDHGGTIQLISSPGEGARFRVFLPAAKPQSEVERDK